MASWDRFGEDRKYTATKDTNVNPKHVGESLRQLTPEDRLELRKIAREEQKRKACRKEALSDDEPALDDSGDEVAGSGQASQASKPPKVKPNGVVEEDDDLAVVGTVATNAPKLIEDLDAVPVVPVSNRERVRKPANDAQAVPPKIAKTTTRAAKAVEDLDAVVELDDEASQLSAAAAARKARRKANAATAKAAAAPPLQLLLQVLE